MKHRIFKKTIALLLAICLLPVIRPIHAVTEEDSPLSSASEVQTQSALEPATKKDTSNSTEVFSALVEGTQILSHINEDVFRGNKHVTRLLYEEDLNNYIFLNSDGSKTVYYMDEEVKFIDAKGAVREKNLSLSSVRDGFSTTLNDVGLTLPIKPSSGIRLTYSGYDITLTPEGGSNLVVARQNGNCVTYPDYFGTGMSLVYTPTLSGVKEDILLDRYRGVTDFTFLLETDGLGLYQSNGKYYLAAAENAEMRIDLGEVVAYDSAGHFSLGSMTVATVTANQQYRLTLHANEDFLQDANTVYPVWIDPSLEVSDNTHGINAIQDITLYSGRPNANCNWQYLACGYYDSTYQRGRTLVRLSGLTSSSAYTSVTADQIASVKFYIKEATGSDSLQIKLYHNFSSGDWVETTATWNSLFQYVNDDNFNSDTLYATANAVSNTYTEFNITQLVKNWKTWVHSPDKGFILKVADETAPHKAFCSSEYSNSSDRPYVVFNYYDGGGSIELREGDIYTMPTTGLSGTIAWGSSNATVATVNESTGVVTAHKAGYTEITATVNGAPARSFHLYVAIADGVYYIRNNLSGYYLGVENSDVDALTGTRQEAKRTANPTRLSQLWKITYLNNGFYSIRPMHKLDKGLSVTGTTVDINNAGIIDIATSVPNTCIWSISYDTSGYLFKNGGNDSKAMRPNGLSSTINTPIVTGTSSASSACRWTMEDYTSSISDQIVFYDARNQSLTTNPTCFVAPEEIRSLSDLGISASFVSRTTNAQSIRWTSNNTTKATVNSITGTVTGVAAGSTAIRAYEQSKPSTIGTYTLSVTEIPEGTYYLRNKQTEMYADIDDPNMPNGTLIQQWSFHGENSQKWIFEHRGDGTYTISSAIDNNTLYYMGVEGNSTEDGAYVLLRSGAIGAGMVWRIEKTASGAYKLIPNSGAADGLVLALDINDTTNGLEIFQLEYVNDNSYVDEWYVCSLDVSYLLAINDVDGANRNEYFNETKSYLETQISNIVPTVLTKTYSSCSIAQMIDYMQSSDLFFIHTHGNKDRFKLGDSSFITMNDFANVNLSDTRLVLLLACYTALDYSENNVINNTPNNIVEQIAVCGAETVVGFTTATLVSDCNQFAKDFSELIVNQGYSVEDAINRIEYDANYTENMSEIAVIAGNKNNIIRGGS